MFYLQMLIELISSKKYWRAAKKNSGNFKRVIKIKFHFMKY